ncbi:MAG: 23S rRNA (adenine(2030)-N(6))-methyltransferase RlmJ [Burkholderiales bacterium]|nr:23S rRNA (adenine(2030)-N(6))-methyltransferase RlmJ [Burkholderiales bacterium]
MLSYRHMFHAGNFADVFKHALLARLLVALARKDKPWCYLDTHAGIGRYDLMHEWAQKAREYDNGIARLWGRKDMPEALAPYIDAVKAANPFPNLRFYPGSPLIARHFARPGDRLVLAELNKVDFEELRSVFAGDRQVSAHLMDGYQGLKAFLPPKERRGLVLLDSSFDRSREFARIAAALKAAHARWETGIYAVWYPLMTPGAMLGFERDVLRTGIRKILRLELRIAPEGSATIPGCGMLVVNPPWKFDTEARPLLDWLWKVLSTDGTGEVRVDWLVPE